jgi:hypothetical protein
MKSHLIFLSHSSIRMSLQYSINFIYFPKSLRASMPEIRQSIKSLTCSKLFYLLLFWSYHVSLSFSFFIILHIFILHNSKFLFELKTHAEIILLKNIYVFAINEHLG